MAATINELAIHEILTTKDFEQFVSGLSNNDNMKLLMIAIRRLIVCAVQQIKIKSVGKIFSAIYFERATSIELLMS